MPTSPPERHHMLPERHLMKQLDQLSASTAPQPTSHIDDANATLSSQPAISIEGLGPVSDNHTPLQESPTPLPNNHFPHLEPQTTPNPFVVNNHNNHPGDAATEHSPTSATPDCADSLPPHATLSATPFRWGEVPSHVFSSDIASAYEEQVLWRKNIFSPPPPPPPHRTRWNRVCQGTHTAPTRIQGQDAT